MATSNPHLEAHKLILIPEEVKFRPLFVTITTIGFVNFTKNWLVSLQKNEIYDSLVLCGDAECYETLKQFSATNQVQLIDKNESFSEHKGFADFGSKNYRKVVNERSAIMHSLLMEQYNSAYFDAVFFMDSDFVITNNFVPLLEKEYLYFDKTEQIFNDFIFMKDVKDFECKQTSDGPYCGCIMFVPFHKTLSDVIVHKRKINFVFGKWYNTTHRKGLRGRGNADQQPMNRAVRDARAKTSNYWRSDHRLREGVLDCTHFPSGWSMQNESWINTFWADPQNRTVQAVHANFVSGYDNKVQLLNRHGLWYI